MRGDPPDSDPSSEAVPTSRLDLPALRDQAPPPDRIGSPTTSSTPTIAWRDQLTEDERGVFGAGDLDAVIASTSSRGRRDLAARVRELVWDFAAAADDWQSVGALVDALRCAIEASDNAKVATLLTVIREAELETRRAGIVLLERRGRRADAATITIADDSDDVLRRARSLERAGDPLSAAALLQSAGRDREALSMLGRLDERESHGPRWALAAKLHWSLGDAEGTIRAAQAARRTGRVDEAEARLLARALGSLGHDTAGELVLGSIPRAEHDDTPALHGRYRVTRLAEAPLVGTAYDAVDRTTLQEVEVHLLLGERGEREDPDGRVRVTLERFAGAAEGASRLGHPAIRPVLYVDPRLGVLILPRASGPTLERHLAARRAVSPVQARAWIAFLLDALSGAHARGIVHGGPYPSSLVEDALGRPTLGPFGVDALAGLAVTRTATLQELLTFSAPEVRAGAAATPQSDVWSLGRLLLALVLGTSEMPGAGGTAATPSVGGVQRSPWEMTPETSRALRSLDPELPTIVATLCHPDPQRRPAAAEARALVAPRVADASRLTGPSTLATSSLDGPTDSTIDTDGLVQGDRRVSRTSPSARAMAMGTARAVEVAAAPTWTPSALDALARIRAPILQPVLDRHDTTFFLASWPSGSALAPPDLDLTTIQQVLWKEREASDAETRAAIDGILERLARRGHEGVVRTPSGEWFVALDAILVL